jgi:hypothetical protein
MIKPSVYKLGTQPPYLKPDPGAGAWNSKTATLEMKALKEALQNSITQGLAAHFGGQDAVDHIQHYLGNSGSTLTIKFQKMINEVKLAKQAHDAQIEAAKKFIESLPPGTHQFTADTGSLNHAIGKADSVNWFFRRRQLHDVGRGHGQNHAHRSGQGKVRHGLRIALL